MKRIVLALIVMSLAAGSLTAQPLPNLNKRILNRMSNQRVEEYLAKNDIIFVPVGVTEMHGGFPTDCETVLAQAFALKMAEQVDAITLDGLPYFFAGGTVIGAGTLELSVRDGIDYLQNIAHSLLRQGFRRQVYVAFHGPAHFTISPVIRDFFNETMVPIQLIDLTKVALAGSNVNLYANASFYSMYIAAYDLLGRIEDVELTTPEHDHSKPSPGSTAFLGPLNALGYQSGALGSYFGKPSDHAVTPNIPTAEARKKMAEDGKVMIDAIVKSINVANVVKTLRDLDTFTREKVVPAYGSRLPGVYNTNVR